MWEQLKWVIEPFITVTLSGMFHHHLCLLFFFFKYISRIKTTLSPWSKESSYTWYCMLCLSKYTPHTYTAYHRRRPKWSLLYQKQTTGLTIWHTVNWVSGGEFIKLPSTKPPTPTSISSSPTSSFTNDSSCPYLLAPPLKLFVNLLLPPSLSHSLSPTSSLSPHLLLPDLQPPLSSYLLLCFLPNLLFLPPPLHSPTSSSFKLPLLPRNPFYYLLTYFLQPPSHSRVMPSPWMWWAILRNVHCSLFKLYSSTLTIYTFFHLFRLQPSSISNPPTGLVKFINDVSPPVHLEWTMHSLCSTILAYLQRKVDLSTTIDKWTSIERITYTFKFQDL